MKSGMFQLLTDHESVYSSDDHLMQAGLATLAGIRLQYSSLGDRLVTLSDIQGLQGFFAKLDPELPLLLLSCCSGFSATPVEEAEGLVFQAGALRRSQQAFKQAGGSIVSVIHRVSVGGVYLMHGLSAQLRLALPDTVFHDTVPARPPVPLAEVLQRGLIHEIVTPEVLPVCIKHALGGHWNIETHH